MRDIGTLQALQLKFVGVLGGNQRQNRNGDLRWGMEVKKTAEENFMKWRMHQQKTYFKHGQQQSSSLNLRRLSWINESRENQEQTELTKSEKT
jgi:hypothetical protein